MSYLVQVHCTGTSNNMLRAYIPHNHIINNPLRFSQGRCQANMSALSRQSTRASITQDSSVPVAFASALVAAGVTWALKPNRGRGKSTDTVLPKELVGVPYSEELELAIEVALKGKLCAGLTRPLSFV